jgi:hypothetical protein
MIDSTTLRAIVDQRSAASSQLVVEADAGSQAEKALKDTHSKARQSAGTVAFKGEQILAGPEDGLDPLADGRKMRTLAGFVPAVGSNHRGPQILGSSGELPTGVTLVAQKDFPAWAVAASQEFETHLPLIALRRSQRQGSRGAVRGEDPMQPKSPEVTGMAGTVSIVSGVGKSGALGCLSAAGTLDRGGVDEQEVVGKTRAPLGKDAHEPLDAVRQSVTTFEVARLAGKLRKEVAKTLSGNGQEPAVRRDAHDGLSHAQSDDLGIGCPPAGVGSLWQKIIGRAINDGAEGVEVGVHRGLRAGGVFGTVDFGLSASNPSCTAILVESII